MSRAKKRGSIRKSNCVFVGAWFPMELVEGIDRLVSQSDTDRSKLLRAAVGDKIARTQVGGGR